MDTLATPPFPLAGELAALGAAMAWAVSISIYTHFGRGIPSRSLNLYKCFVAIVCLMTACLIVGPRIPENPLVFFELALSGIIGLAAGDTALFAALKRLGAQMTSASQCMAPPLAALVAMIFLNETLTAFELVGMSLTVGSVAAVIATGRSPKGADKAAALEARSLLIAGAGFAVVAAACQAVGLVIVRHALQEVHLLLGTLGRILPALCVLLGVALLREGGDVRALFKAPSRTLILTFAAFLGTFVGILLMSAGAKYAKAGIAASLSATYPVWIIPIARLFLKESVSWKSVVYTLMAVAGIGLMVA